MLTFSSANFTYYVTLYNIGLLVKWKYLLLIMSYSLFGSFDHIMRQCLLLCWEYTGLNIVVLPHYCRRS